MGVRFNANEVLEMAIQIERNGREFYRLAAELQNDSDLRHQLNSLSQMEAIHEKLFSRMKNELEAVFVQEFDPEDDAVRYLQSLVRGVVFDRTNPNAVLDGTHTTAEVLTMAVALEKDSIVFYLGIRDLVPEHLGRDRIEDIIREEQRHVVQLSERLSTLSR